jgi:hypothetical protein
MTILPPKVPPGTPAGLPQRGPQTTWSLRSGTVPAASRTVDLFLRLSNRPKGSPVHSRKTALTWEPPYGIEP